MIQPEKTWFVVCKTSKEFNTAQAAAIRRQFFKASSKRDWEFVCLTDRPTESWHEPLISDNPGWWSLMEVYRFKGPHVLTGLDTLLIGDLDPLLEFAERCPEDKMFGIRDFYKPDRWASGVTIWNGDWSRLYHSCTESEMRKYRGNQDFVEAEIASGRAGGSLGYLQDHLSGIVSFKAHVRPKGGTPPAGTRICCFHGKPRPWEVASEYPWVADKINI